MIFTAHLVFKFINRTGSIEESVETHLPLSGPELYIMNYCVCRQWLNCTSADMKGWEIYRPGWGREAETWLDRKHDIEDRLQRNHMYLWYQIIRRRCECGCCKSCQTPYRCSSGMYVTYTWGMIFIRQPSHVQVLALYAKLMCVPAGTKGWEVYRPGWGLPQQTEMDRVRVLAFAKLGVLCVCR